MKPLLSMFLVLTTLVNLPQGGTSGQGPEPFSIVIAAADSTVKINTDLVIKVRLTNNSDHPINASYHVLQGVNMGYQYEVRDANGNVPPHKEQKSGMEGSLRLRTLNPGESLENTVTLNRLYDMSVPGKYVIQFSRNISGYEKDGVVRSNKITVTVTP